MLSHSLIVIHQHHFRPLMPFNCTGHTYEPFVLPNRGTMLFLYLMASMYGSFGWRQLMRFGSSPEKRIFYRRLERQDTLLTLDGRPVGVRPGVGSSALGLEERSSLASMHIHVARMAKGETCFSA